MSFISTVEARMPPGFRFHPTDEELVLDYLLHKLSGHDRAHSGVALVDVDLNKCEPWDLPDAASVGRKEWYFFNLRDRKYATGQRTNRATLSGYWKATGKDRTIVAGKGTTVVGMRKTLVFYRGRAPKGRKTDWVMHEFRLLHPPPASRPGREQLPVPVTRHQQGRLKEDWVLCRVFYKSRATTPRLSPDDAEAGTPPTKPNLPVPSLVATYTAFDGAPRTAEQVSSFSGLPALPFSRPVSLGDDLLAFDTPEKEVIRTVVSNMSSNSSSGIELPPNWELENGLAQMWDPL